MLCYQAYIYPRGVNDPSPMRVREIEMDCFRIKELRLQANSVPQRMNNLRAAHLSRAQGLELLAMAVLLAHFPPMGHTSRPSVLLNPRGTELELCGRPLGWNASIAPSEPQFLHL